MKSLQWRLTLWFTISILLVTVALMLSAHWHLDHELRKEKWERTHPAQPDWILHGSFTDAEVHDILGELAGFWLMVSAPILGLAIASAYLIARGSMRPIERINQQLSRVDIRTLSEPIRAPDADPAIGELVRHFNALLRRLQVSFQQLQEFAGQVAHELRTPLQLMRLRIEANAATMKPELAEELEEELSRLSRYVETALTIARAEQGGLKLNIEPLALKEFLTDNLEPFARLALAEGRCLRWSCPDSIRIQVNRDAFKQILFNLLSNALKHGNRDIFLRVHRRRDWVSLLLGNRAATPGAGLSRGLGIGLRLVQALMSQFERARLTVRRQDFFCVKLQFPANIDSISSGSNAVLANRVLSAIRNMQRCNFPL